MATIECKICGGFSELPEGRTLGSCVYCGNQVTLPRVSDEAHAAAFNRGNHFRRIGEFDKALAVYERIVQQDEANAEAHWCCALCRFGIEYVQDPATGMYLPTCHRASYDSFLQDVDVRAAIAHSDADTARQYQRDAEAIAQVQRDILATIRDETPFDVFICYKETDTDGQRTRDSLLAQDVYYQLTDQGMRVFFARITLEDKPGTAYEPYIFAALNTAKVMVVVGTKPEHLGAVWVRNEWSRFLALMKHDRTRLLIPCYRDMDPYDMPEQLSILQSYDMNRIGFLQDLVRGIRKVVGEEKPAAPQAQSAATPQAAPSTEPLLRRIALFLEDGDWHSADEYCERVLDIDPENARAYVGKLMAALHVTRQEKLKDQAQPFDRNPNYAKALRFADEELAGELRGMIAYINERNDNAAKEAAYQSAEQALTNAKTERDFLDAKKLFEALGSWKDAAKQTELCTDKAEEAHKNNIYEKARLSMTIKPTEATLSEAIRMFQTIPGWKDADQQIEACQRMIEELKAKAAAEAEERQRREEAAREARRKAVQQRNRRVGIGTAVLAAVVAVVLLVTQVIIPNGKYNAAVALMESGDYEAAIAVFEALGGYKDSQARIDSCNTAIMDGKYDAAVALMNAGQYDAAIATFEALGGYKDSQARIDSCNTAIMDGKYDAAVALMNAGQYDEAIAAFEALGGYRDSQARIDSCNTAIMDGKYDAAVALMNAGQYDEAIAAFEALGGYKDSQTQIVNCNTAIMDGKYNAAVALMENGNYEAAIDAFEALGGYKDSQTQIVNCNTAIMDGKYNAAVALMENGDYEAAITAFRALGDYKDSKAQIAICDTAIMDGKYNAAVALMESGDTALAAIAFSKLGDYNDAHSRSMELWDGIAVRDTIAAGNDHTVGLRADGSVVAVGRNGYGQCDTSAWSDIIAIAAGEYHTVGLRADGTVVVVGSNGSGQCNTSAWSDIVAIAAGDEHTVGLRADGTVVAVGDNDYGQCNTSAWSDIVAIAAGDEHTVGLRADGSVVAVGWNGYGQCKTSAWSGIVAIAACFNHTVGLRADGTFVAAGENQLYSHCDTSAWSDIIAIAVDDWHSVGLRADGTVVAVGWNEYGQCNTSAWSDIVAIAAGDEHTVGLRADGTVVAVGDNDYGQCNVTDWQLKQIPRPTLPE